MKLKNIINRILLYPFGLLKSLHVLGKNGSRDFNNKFRFKNVIIDDGVCIDFKALIKPNVHLLSNCIINNTNIDSYTYVGKNTIVQNAVIGKFCSISNDVFIGLGSHPIDYFSTSPIFYRKKNIIEIDLILKDYSFQEYENIKIGNDVWIGAKAIVLDGITIGHGAVVAANAVVTKDIPPYAIVGGVPAKILKYRFNDTKIKKLLESNWWDNDLEAIKNKIEDLNNGFN
jgi:chloramphenicol O-acetyltransferase type B